MLIDYPKKFSGKLDLQKIQKIIEYTTYEAK